MKREEIIKNVTYIKEIIESANHYTNLSGPAGILSGGFALIGCYLTYALLGTLNLAAASIKWTEVLISLSLIWLIIFICATGLQLIFTIRKARRLEIPFWTKLSRQVIFALAPSLLAGAVLTVYLVRQDQLIFIPPVWILLYGVGVVAAGMFSTVIVRLLGWAFVLTSCLPLFIWPAAGLIFLAVTFGGYHIIYGLIVLVKYRD
ncbi:MAG: hypothetical protein KAS70_01140 [Planctomycetes bacterium]|nr:hypothetical protein [Planctomycetota bacterium]